MLLLVNGSRRQMHCCFRTLPPSFTLSIFYHAQRLLFPNLRIENHYLTLRLRGVSARSCTQAVPIPHLVLGRVTAFLALATLSLRMRWTCIGRLLDCLHPPHRLLGVKPRSPLELTRGVELSTIKWHRVKDVEQNCVREQLASFWRYRRAA